MAHAVAGEPPVPPVPPLAAPPVPAVPAVPPVDVLPPVLELPAVAAPPVFESPPVAAPPVFESPPVVSRSQFERHYRGSRAIMGRSFFREGSGIDTVLAVHDHNRKCVWHGDDSKDSMGLNQSYEGLAR